MQHPLISDRNKHYEIFKDLEGIEVIEKTLSVGDLIGACKFNILKYQLRLGKKGTIEDFKKDIKKIEDYQKYLSYLQEVKNEGEQ